jgi:hypothetical protein
LEERELASLKIPHSSSSLSKTSKKTGCNAVMVSQVKRHPLVANVCLIASIGARTPRKAVRFSRKPQAEQGIPYDLVFDSMIPVGVIVRKPYLSTLPKEILRRRLKRFLLFQCQSRHPKAFARTEFPTWNRSCVVFQDVMLIVKKAST